MYLYRIKPDGAALGRWQLGDQPLVIGRDEDASVRIPDYRMSGRHFAIARDGDTFILHDLDSKNGTWVNGLRVTAWELDPEDRITAGHTLFSMEAGLTTTMHQLNQLQAAGTM